MKQFKIFKVIALILVTSWVLSFFLFYNKIIWSGTLGALEGTEGMVVLTGGPGRIEEALVLMEAGHANKLLISGVHPDVAEKTLQDMSGKSQELFDCCVDIEHKALDTVGNAVESAEWAADNKLKSLTIVTAHYHMPRALVEFRRHHKDIILVPYAVKSDVSLQYLVTEHHKYLFALLKGK